MTKLASSREPSCFVDEATASSPQALIPEATSVTKDIIDQ